MAQVSAAGPPISVPILARGWDTFCKGCEDTPELNRFSFYQPVT
jgi:hypothetical protein